MEENNQASNGKSGEQNGNGKASEPRAVGLDVGTSRIVLANGVTVRQFNSQLNAFVSVPYSKMTASMLGQNNMAYYRNGTEMFIYGTDSERFASTINATPRRPMQQGVINAHETMSLQVIQAIIERMVPAARKGAVLCFSVPGKGEGADANLVYHEAVLKNFLQSLGYEAKAVNEGQAVIFSELQNENFTGIGISCGGGMCNVCASYLAVPMLSFSIPKAGDYIDESVARVVDENITQVRLYKENQLDLTAQPNDKIGNALHIYYEDLMTSLITKLREEFSNSRNLPNLDRPLPIVISGGTATPRGFLQKFEAKLKASDFPVKIANVRLAGDPLTATAHGCHVAAMSELDEE